MITNTYTTFAAETTEIPSIIEILTTEYSAKIISTTTTNLITFTLTETPEILNNLESDLDLTKIN